MNNNPPPYKLVLVLQDLEFGGTQRYAINLLRHLDRNLFDPELWVLRGGVDMLPLVEKTGTRIRWFSKGNRVTAFALCRFFLALLRDKPVILYSLTVVPNIWARIFGYLLGVQGVVSSYRNLFANQYEQILWRLSTHTICNAEAIREKLVEKHGVPKNRISVVPNGIDTVFFTPDSAKQVDQPTILYVGRLVPQKDPLTLLEAFRRVQQIVPEVKLIMVGNGPLRAQLEEFIERYSLVGCVSLVNGTVNIKKYMQQSQILLLSSLYEGSPNVLLEAMACGLPVVATKTSGIPELVEHEKNGYLVSPGDSKGMADYVVRLLHSKRLRDKMSKEAEQKINKDHKLEDCVRLTEKILLKCLL